MSIGSFTGFSDAMLAPIVVLVLVAVAVGFLMLVSRVCWAAREFVATCRERQKTHRRLVEILQEQLETRDPCLDQIWSASAALGSC
ncbi:MAG TPA: hypothetical protein VGZ29_13675 [Terriglobia bacterium]|nr:hypothetical protein [Terriglobia bacterium]